MDRQERKDAIVERIKELAILLGGTKVEVKESRRNYRGRLSKFISIEYDVEE